MSAATGPKATRGLDQGRSPQPWPPGHGPRTIGYGCQCGWGRRGLRPRNHKPQPMAEHLADLQQTRINDFLPRDT